MLERTGVSGYRLSPVALDKLNAAGAEALARELAPLQLEESSASIDLAAEVRLSDLLDEPTGAAVRTDRAHRGRRPPRA